MEFTVNYTQTNDAIIDAAQGLVRPLLGGISYQSGNVDQFESFEALAEIDGILSVVNLVHSQQSFRIPVLDISPAVFVEDFSTRSARSLQLKQNDPVRGNGCRVSVCCDCCLSVFPEIARLHFSSSQTD